MGSISKYSQLPHASKENFAKFLLCRAKASGFPWQPIFMMEQKMAKAKKELETDPLLVNEQEEQEEQEEQPKIEEVYQLSTDEFFEISRSLEDKHAIFYKLWEIGRPVFTNSVPTAEVRMDRDGNGVAFLFNYKWWKKLSPYTRKFVICHEMLHLILNHGIRIRDAQTGLNTVVNKGVDIVVNHLLLKKFRFDRTSL